MSKYSRRTDTNRDLALTRRPRQIAAPQTLHRVLKRYRVSNAASLMPLKVATPAIKTQAGNMNH